MMSAQEQIILTLRVNSAGHMLVEADKAEQGVSTPREQAEALQQAFAKGAGQGLLYLGTVALSWPLSEVLSYWRQRIYEALKRLKQEGWQMELPSGEALKAWIEGSPRMKGSSYLKPKHVEAHLAQIMRLLQEEDSSPAEALSRLTPSWRHGERVWLHLAERRKDPDYPFAFMATYAKLEPGRAQLQHVPLRQRLEQLKVASQGLGAVLRSLEAGAAASPVFKGLYEGGELYQPMAWTAAQAHEFLQQAGALDQAGLVVRHPNWWRQPGQAKLNISVKLGDDEPGRLSAQALLDFDVGVSLGHEALTDEEIKALWQAQAGLVLLRGQWVELDQTRLREVFERWQQAQKHAEEEGLSLSEALKLLMGVGLGGAQGEEVAQQVREWSSVMPGQWLSAQLEQLRDPQAQAELVERAALKATLRPYQDRGLRWLWTLRTLGLGGVLADDMGLGKTIQVIALLSLAQAQLGGDDQVRAHLIVAPASLMENWRLELERFAPHLSVFIAHRSEVDTQTLEEQGFEELSRAHDVIITTYATAHRLEALEQIKWRSVILDEAQAIKNAQTKQAKALKRLDATWRLAMTGTPVENSLGDLWSIFDFINPGLLGSAKEFNQIAGRLKRDEGSGLAPLRELVSPYMLRRLKSDPSIIDELPEKIEQTTYCSLSKQQVTLYKKAVVELELALKTLPAKDRSSAILASLIRFKQICDHPSLWLKDGVYKASHSGKFEQLEVLCQSIAANREKALIFTQFTEIIPALEEHLRKLFKSSGLVLHGKTPIKARQGLVKQFQEDDKLPFMILSLKAGGTGLNLTQANHIIHFDRWWNPAVEDQATDRAHRIGQRRSVHVHKLVCAGTIEDKIDLLIQDKRQLADAILSSEEQLKLTELSDEALLELVSLDLSRAVS